MRGSKTIHTLFLVGLVVSLFSQQATSEAPYTFRKLAGVGDAVEGEEDETVSIQGMANPILENSFPSGHLLGSLDPSDSFSFTILYSTASTPIDLESTPTTGVYSLEDASFALSIGGGLFQLGELNATVTTGVDEDQFLFSGTGMIDGVAVEVSYLLSTNETGLLQTTLLPTSSEVNQFFEGSFIGFFIEIKGGGYTLDAEAPPLATAIQRERVSIRGGGNPIITNSFPETHSLGSLGLEPDSSVVFDIFYDNTLVPSESSTVTAVYSFQDGSFSLSFEDTSVQVESITAQVTNGPDRDSFSVWGTATIDGVDVDVKYQVETDQTVALTSTLLPTATGIDNLRELGPPGWVGYFLGIEGGGYKFEAEAAPFASATQSSKVMLNPIALEIVDDTFPEGHLLGPMLQPGHLSIRVIYETGLIPISAAPTEVEYSLPGGSFAVSIANTTVELNNVGARVRNDYVVGMGANSTESDSFEVWGDGTIDEVAVTVRYRLQTDWDTYSSTLMPTAGDIRSFGSCPPTCYEQLLLIEGGGYTLQADMPPRARDIQTRIQSFGPTGTNPTINNPGEVVFTAILESGKKGIFVTSGGVIRTIASTLTTLAAVGDRDTRLGVFTGGLPQSNDRGVVAFGATMPDLGDRFDGGWGIFTGDSREINLIADTAGDVRGFSQVSINNDGIVAYTAHLEGLQSAIYTSDGSLIAASGADFSSFAGHTINDEGSVVFAAELVAGGYGLCEHVNGQNNVLLDTSDEFVYFGNPSLNNLGAVAFRAVLDEGGEYSGIFVKDTQEGGNQEIQKFVDTRDPVSQEYGLLGEAQINDQGVVVFTAVLNTMEQGIYTGPDPTSDKVIQAGDDLLGSAVVELNVSRVKLNNAGQITFFARLADGSSGVYRADPGTEPIAELVADSLEVTQSAQNLLRDPQAKVRLVARKRTYVRFHVYSTSSVPHRATAVLKAENGAGSIEINPRTYAGEISVRPDPNRGAPDQSFLFELPEGYKEGTVTLTATLNLDRAVMESSYENNEISETITFEEVPPVDLVVYRLGYLAEIEENGDIKQVTLWPPEWQRDQMLEWLKRAYPISELRVDKRDLFVEGTLPNRWCGVTNTLMLAKRAQDLQDPTVPLTTRYYGLLDDRGYNGYFLGCAGGIPSPVASGLTGTDLYRWGLRWDTDGCYGDWLAGHELGHAWGRYHAEFCGAGGGRPYPYPSGQISATLTGDAALYGLDIATTAVYPPDWHDVMTYCDNVWVSDFTYHGLMDAFQTFAPAAMAKRRKALDLTETDRLLVVGQLDPETNEVDLLTPFVIADSVEVKERIPGDYAIVLRNAQGGELARYEMTPERQIEDPRQLGQEPSVVLLIDELVPWVAGTAQIDIDGPGGLLLHSVSAGGSPPEVTVTSPNGGEFLAGRSITVTWTADDADGDPLTFNVEYSPDNGATWETVAVNVTGNSVELTDLNIANSSEAVFRVSASDGIHTAADTSDDNFAVPNRAPEVRIIEPVATRSAVVGETITFEGEAYDLDIGTLAIGQLSWFSSVDGLLGTGPSLSVNDLSPGGHIVTFQADDGDGGVATDTVEVEVLEDPDQVPPPVDALVSDRELIRFEPLRGETSQRLTVRNSNEGRIIDWKAVADEDWLFLSQTEGMTPGVTIVSFLDTGLQPGLHAANITLTSSAVPGMTLLLPVEVDTVVSTAFRRGDADATGAIDVTDVVFSLGVLFLGTGEFSCEDAADTNDDGKLDVSDPITSLGFQFLGGVMIPEPGPNTCGIDPTEDQLDCESFTLCD